MKAYLFVTGALFGLIAAMHAFKAFVDRSELSTRPGHYLLMSALGAVAAGLSIWAWRLLWRHGRDRGLQKVENFPDSPDARR